MENNQYPNNQQPINDQNVPPSEPAEPRYVRAEEVTSTMAESVGVPYDNPVSDETQVYQVQGMDTDATAGEATQELPKTDTMTSQGVAANEAQAGSSEIANSVSVPPQAPSGKTKRKKHGNFGKFLAMLLIGALVGGATGGVVGYQLAVKIKARRQ